MKVQLHEMSRNPSRHGIAVDVSNSGYKALDTIKWRPLIKATVIHRCPNGLGAIEWLDDEGRALLLHQGVLDEGTPGTASYLPRLGLVTEVTYA